MNNSNNESNVKEYDSGGYDWGAITVIVVTIMFTILGTLIWSFGSDEYDRQITEIKTMNCDDLKKYLNDNIDGSTFLGKTGEVAQKLFDLNCKEVKP